MKRILLILILCFGCNVLYTKGFDRDVFKAHQKTIEMHVREELKVLLSGGDGGRICSDYAGSYTTTNIVEQLNNIEELEIVPFPMYEIKVNRFGEVWLKLDTENCSGILLDNRDVVGIAMKRKDTPYQFLFFDTSQPASDVQQGYPPVFDTLMVAGRAIAIDVSPLQCMKPLNTDSIKIVFGRSYSIKEKLSMALERGEDLFGIYSFLLMPMLNMGIGVVDHDNVLYLKFIYPKPPIVYHDLKSFFDSNYQTIKDYRRLKKFWDKNKFIKQ